MTRKTAIAIVLPVLFAVSACGAGEKKAAEPEPVRIESPSLGIVLVDPPAEFEVASNGEGRLVLRAPDGGTVTLERGTEAEDSNLVQAVKDHQAAIEGREGGEYLGVRELVTPLGSAFWSRGRYPGEHGTLEETRIVTLHPSGQGILTLTYVYPAGEDSSARIQSLLGLVVAVEALQPQATG